MNTPTPSFIIAPKYHGNDDCPLCRGAGSFELESANGGMFVQVCGQCNAPVNYEADHIATFNRDQDALYALIEARQLQESDTVSHAHEIADALQAPIATPIPDDYNHSMAMGHTVGAISAIVRPSAAYDDAAMVQQVRQAIAELRKWERNQ